MVKRDLRDGSTVYYQGKQPVAMANRQYRRVFCINRTKNLKLNEFLDIIQTYQECKLVSIPVQKMHEKILLIQAYDYSKGEIDTSPGYLEE